MQTAHHPALSRRAIRTRLLLTLIYAALVPYLIYRVSTERFHLSPVNALLLAALSPAVGSLIEFVRKRQLSVLGVFALVGIAAKVASALLFHDARLVLISDSGLPGVFGLLLLLAISVLLTFTLPIATVVLIRPVVDYGMIAALVLGTVAYSSVVLQVRKRRQSAREGNAEWQAETC